MFIFFAALNIRLAFTAQQDWLVLNQKRRNGETGNGERGAGNGESLKGGISKMRNL